MTQQYPLFLQNVFSFLTCTDPTLRLIAIQTIGALAQSESGLQVVFHDKTQTSEVMTTLCTNIRSPDADIRMRSLEALAAIFHTADVPSEDLSGFVRSLFSAMTSNPLQLLLEVAKQPFEDVRCAVLAIFRNLAKYKWAQEEMTQCPGQDLIFESLLGVEATEGEGVR